MGSVAVVTDSTADMPPLIAAAAGITVVPLYVRFGSQELRDGVDVTPEQFWERLLTPGSPFPSTAAPSPGTFRETFETLFAGGADAIVCPTIGSGLSGTFGSATVAAGMLPDREIHVIDTGTTSMGTGIAALLAAELAATGVAADEVASNVRGRLTDIDLYVAVDTLEYLQRNGRLSAARAAIGTLLSIKPIITVRDGLVVLAEKPRTRGRARERVIELATAGPLERIAILYTPTSSRREIDDFRDRLVSRIPGGVDPGRVMTGLIGATTGPHLGPGMIGAVFLRRH
jgi:DegV family protein with EDD domain